jgi:sterol desaturase/sphingolipid hydroxylase (fatty acid hydroxylase superfamily)
VPCSQWWRPSMEWKVAYDVCLVLLVRLVMTDISFRGIMTPRLRSSLQRWHSWLVRGIRLPRGLWSLRKTYVHWESRLGIWPPPTGTLSVCWLMCSTRGMKPGL